jgi:hypothetical protein
MNKDFAERVIEVATRNAHHGPMASSAKLVLQDAQHCFDKRDYYYAAERGIESLKYSLGVFNSTVANFMAEMKKAKR